MTRNFAFLLEKNLMNETSRSPGHVQKASDSVCSQTTVVSPSSFIANPSTSAGMKTLHITKKKPLMTLTHHMNKKSIWNNSLISCEAQI
jgi:hypothetical protein